MKIVLQRVSRAEVRVEGRVTGRIDAGFLLLAGFAPGDTPETLGWMADKVLSLRLFPDEAGKMNRSLADAGGAMLVVSQFTLLGDCRKGRRPSFDAAAPPDVARALYEQFVASVREQGIEVATGRFREMMQVELTNDGPVTLLLDSRKAF